MIIFRGQLSKTLKHLRSFSSTSVLSSEKNKDDKKEEKKLSQEEASKKLKDLLNFMIENEDTKPKQDIQLAQAGIRKKVKPVVKEKPLAEKLEGAAKEVAESLGGDVKKTESELLNILLRKSDSSPDVLKDVISGMKIEKPQETKSKAQQVRDQLATPEPNMGYDRQPPALERRKLATRRDTVKVNFSNATPTTYFRGLQPQPAPCELRTWQSCVDRDLRLAVTHPPTNIYEQMIIWTDRDMLWKFPIDNEQGLEEERKVSFDEHVLLEVHLEGWCPEKGPIRHFMELICVGLSKNHWLTVEEKKEHIMWYRDYFAEKQDLLTEVGAGVINVEPTDQKEVSSSQ